MPVEYYTKVVDDEGNESFALIEDIEIPDDVFFEDERYKTVSNRDIKRRDRFNNLVSTLEAEGYTFERDANGGVLSDENGIRMTKPQAQDEQPAAPQVKVPTMDEIYAEIRQRSTQEQQAAEQAKAEREAVINSAMEQHGLKGDVARNILANSTNPDEVAALLGREQLFFGETNGGATEEEARRTEIDELGARVRKRMGAPE